MSIMNLNGGAVMAMAGKGCYVIISDHRLGEQFKTISMDVTKLHVINDTCILGLTGLRTDQLTFAAKLKYQLELYKLREERNIPGKALCQLVANMLYEHRFGPFFTEPVIASLQPDGSVYLCTTDLIGAASEPADYVVGGTCSESLHGVCEAMWQPDLGPEELFEVAAQAMLSAVDRDCLSGFGATAYIVTKDKITKRVLAGRKD
jgi:20S proteasome subunit beta 3